VEIHILNEIIDRCNHGDLSAYRAIVEEYQGYAYAVAFRVICDEEDAKDIVQETFIRVWNNLNRYDPKVKFTTWLYTIVTNLCYDKLRSRKRKQTVLMNEADISMIASTEINENPEKLLTNNELAPIIETLTEELPPKQKMIFVLRDLQGLHIQEVCEILHLSKSSVKTNLVYARKYLRQKLEPFLVK
jgi:RNA polymerase sigma-70 factor, ECF subfamily